jgi:hypothetical protein
LQQRSKSELRARLRFRNYVRDRNREKSDATFRGFSRTRSVIAPEEFSLIRNPEGVIRFLSGIKTAANTHNVFVDLSTVRSITPDAIAALLATITSPAASISYISGNTPADFFASKILSQSGFRDYVQSQAGQLLREPAMGQVRKRQKSGEALQQTYDQFVAQNLIQFAMNKFLHAQQVHGPSYRIFSEAMLNTLNHAAASGEAHEPWWASVYFDSERNRACFTFIDQGVGIFGSHKLTAFLKIQRTIALLSNSEILKRLFRGEIASTTRIPGRGNGIPGMYSHCKAGRIHNLAIVSNSAMGLAESEMYVDLEIPFQGTAIYWEVGP